MSEGGSGTNDRQQTYDIKAIGQEPVADIVYRSLFHLAPATTFAAIREATIDVTRGLHGECSRQAREVTNAWHAVGVGERYDFPLTCNNVVRVGGGAGGPGGRYPAHRFDPSKAGRTGATLRSRWSMI